MIGSSLLTAITPEDLERLVLGVKSTRYKSQELKAKTKKSIARTLHALFEFTVNKRWRKDNPAAGLVKALTDPTASPDDVVIDQQDKTKYFDAAEAQRLLATCHEQFPDWYAFVLTGLQTGVRLGELRGLCYEQINWHGCYITVDQAYVKDRWTTPKNRKPRTVSMSRDLRAALRSRRLYRFDRSLGSVEALNGRRMHLVFPSRVGTPLQESRIGEFWEKLLEAAGLGYRVRHAMRHTHDSLLIQAGVPVAKIAAESGRSIEETTRTYLHFLPGGNREDAEVLAGLLGGTRKEKSWRGSDTTGSTRMNLKVVKRSATSA